jgi:hypothetical protein
MRNWLCERCTIVSNWKKLLNVELSKKKAVVFLQLRGPKTVIASGVKQSPVIPVETGIQEGRIAMRPYKIASSFHSSQ